MGKSSAGPLIISELSITSDKSTSSTNVDFNSLPLVQLSEWIWTICMPVCFVLGVFGNVMIIVILRRFEASRSALDRYFVCLAVTDLCTNITGPLRDWIRAVMHFWPFALHDVLCKTQTFIINTSVTCSAWFVVVMVTHRAMSVVWPLRVNVVCTAKTSWAIIISVVALLSGAYSHFFYGMEVAGGVCIPKKHYLAFLMESWVYVDILLFSVLPFVCLMISNSVLVVKLRTSVKEAGDHFPATDRQQRERGKKVNSITLTALVVSVFFIIACTLPLGIRNLVDITFFDSAAVKENHELEFSYFLQNLLVLILYINSSMNFYLYCLTGERFRKEFLKVVSGLVRCLRSPKT